jgi:hypothetical protein
MRSIRGLKTVGKQFNRNSQEREEVQQRDEGQEMPI